MTSPNSLRNPGKRDFHPHFCRAVRESDSPFDSSAYWLLKTEPQEYAWANLERAERGVWDGVKNPLALKYLRAMQPTDKALIYHTGKERRVVGIAEIMTEPYPDPALNDPKYVVVDIRAVRSLLHPVTLTQIKQSGQFTDFDLIRLPRLSVVPVSAEHWQQILQLAGE